MFENLRIHVDHVSLHISLISYFAYHSNNLFKGWDKTYCLQFLNSFERILFFGDKTMEGGNDFEIYNHELTESYSVINPEDTITKLTKIFNIN